MATTSKEIKIEGVIPNPVVHILIVGFHHQKGSTIEYSHPPLVIPNKAKESITTSITESCWRHLPHLALPDGCHNYDEESVYFTLPDPTDSDRSVFGVACCRQIEARELTNIDKQVTRSTVQKSVCVLCRYPAFGFIQAKLSLVTHAFFNAKDFSNVEILQETYKGINAALSSSSQINSTLYLSISNRDLVLAYHHRLLQLFKALLLQKRVLVYGSPSLQLCTSVLSIMSLFPNSLQKFARLKSDLSNLELNVFSNASSFQPYLCLQQMEELRGSSRCILAGVVNPLFEKQRTRLCDVFADMSSGQIMITKPSLKSALHLSTADLRFCSLLSETVSEQVTERSDWLGSDAWIRAQFKLYLISLLKTSLKGEETAKEEFYQDFMSAWYESPVYKSWLATVNPKSVVTTVEPRVDVASTRDDVFTNTPPVHVCTGELSVSDLKRRLLAQASDYGLSGEEVVQQTRQAIAMTTERVTSAVSRAWTSASNAVYGWWGGNKQEDHT